MLNFFQNYSKIQEKGRTKFDDAKQKGKFTEKRKKPQNRPIQWLKEKGFKDKQ